MFKKLYRQRAVMKPHLGPTAIRNVIRSCGLPEKGVVEGPILALFVKCENSTLVYQRKVPRR